MSTENTVPSSEIPVPEEKKGLDPRIAFVLMIIMIICALLIGANKAWKKNHSGVDAGFEGWKESVALRCETAYNLLTVADRYVSRDNTQVISVRNDLQQMEETADIMHMSECAVACNSFLTSAQQLLDSLKQDPAVIQDPRDSMYVSLMFPQAMEQCANNTALTVYNDAARTYNNGLHSFSGLLARLTGLGFAEVVSIENDTTGG